MLRTLGKFEGFRQAEPGEFTKRAMFNGKLNALEAEGLNDLINAESESQHYQSVQQMGGTHTQIFENIRQDIIKILAHAEAYIEFEEEEGDVKSDLINQVGDRVRQLINRIEGYLDDNQVGEIIREGIKVSIIGPPNVGKSSLMNALSKRDVAIVSDVPGKQKL